MPDVPKPNGLRASLNSIYCISPEILEESGGRKAKGVRSLFFVGFLFLIHLIRTFGKLAKENQGCRK